MEAMTPSNRTFSPPEEMAAICAFLVSDDARSLYGESIIADEGITTGVG
jgi:3-oxoacyl-[acyl-carrier protein] reductase